MRNSIVTAFIAALLSLSSCGIKGDLRHPDTGQPVHDASSEQEWMSVPIIAGDGLQSQPVTPAASEQ